MKVADGKGDTVAYPKAVLGLPFSDQGNSFFFTDDYEMQCSSASQKATGGGKVMSLNHLLKLHLYSVLYHAGSKFSHVYVHTARIDHA